MNYKECIERYIKEGYVGKDNTCNGTCSKCGECCGIVLPLDQEDANKIQEYVVKHKIFPQRQVQIMQNKLQCPYYTGNKEKGCIIYEARPKICRFYKCNKKIMPLEELKEMKKTIPIDMWAFAKAIEREMKKYGLNKKTRKTTNQSI